MMRDYLARARNSVRQSSIEDLNEARRLERIEAVNFARAYVRLEGFTPSAEAEMRATRFIKVEINLSEFVDAPARVEQEHSR